MNYFSYGRNIDMQKIFLENFYNFGNKTRQVKNSQKLRYSLKEYLWFLQIIV